jgi:hypothetical protein
MKKLIAIIAVCLAATTLFVHYVLRGRYSLLKKKRVHTVGTENTVEV